MSLAEKIRQRNRVNEMAEYLTKEAMSDAGKAFMFTLGGGLASAGVAYGVPAALEAVQGAKVRADKDKLITKMRSAHPELKNFSKKDTDLVYNSLAMHAPKVLKDPLVGGQVMLEALRRGNHMDIGQLSNVSKMTGGSGISDHQRDAANIMAQQVGRGAENYAKDRYDSRHSNQVEIEKIKGAQTRKNQRYAKILEVKGDIEASSARLKPRGPGSLTGAERYKEVRNKAGYEARYRAYKSNKRP